MAPRLAAPRLVLAFCLVLPALAQKTDPGLQVPPPQPPDIEGAVNDLASLRYVDLVEGTGAPAEPGKRLRVHYTGYLTDGSKFDSSVDRGEPFEFIQGRRQVILGWDLGFEGMKVGGKRRLSVPYQMAYGTEGSGSIPPKSELIFDVELLGVEEVPEPAAAADVLVPLEQLEEKVLALAGAIPEEKYDWRPAEGARSFRELFLHVVLGNSLLINAGLGRLEPEAMNAQIEWNRKKEKDTLPKEQVVQILQGSFASVKDLLHRMGPNSLSRETSFFGQTTNLRAVFVSLDVHVGEHLGQAIAYARMNGIVPPWSASDAAQPSPEAPPAAPDPPAPAEAPAAAPAKAPPAPSAKKQRPPAR